MLFREEEILLSIKREAGIDADTPTFLDRPLSQGSSLNHHPSYRLHHQHFQHPLSPSKLTYGRHGHESETDHDRHMAQTSSPILDNHLNNDSSATDEARFERGDMSREERLQRSSRIHSDEFGEDNCVRVSPRMVNDYEDSMMHGDIDDEEQLEEEEREMMGHHHEDSQEDEGDYDHEDGASDTEEREEMSPVIEGPQPTLEAEDDLVDNLPVFPVPHLQPVSSS